MLNKKNIIISSLASVMLTYSFNYIAIAGLSNIDMKKAHNNANISNNKPSSFVNSVGKGIAVRNHALVLKSIDAMKSHLHTNLPSLFIGSSDLEDNPVIAEKRQKALDMIHELGAAENNAEILNSFNPYKVRLARLYKDHTNKLVKINEQNDKANATYQQQVETHKLKMKREEQQLDQQIASLSVKISDIDAKIKAKELTLDADVGQFFTTSVQPKLVTTMNFDRLTVGSLATTISFR